jgi:hypothetical protein
MLSKFLLLTVFIYILFPVNSSADPVNAVPIEVNQAIVSIYGGPKWHDQKLIEFLKTDTGFVTAQFWSRLSVNGVNRLLVIVSIEPKEIPDENHVPLIGGAILKQVGSKWIVESENKILGWGGKHNDIGAVSIVRVGKEKYGIEITESDEVRGFESISTRVFIPVDQKLELALEVAAGGPEGDGPCENKNFPPQSLGISYISVPNSEYFDINSSAEYNEGDCDNNVRRETQTLYHLHNGKYSPE